MKHKHQFEKDESFNRRYCRENIVPQYQGFTWQAERFVCRVCGKAKYEKTLEVHNYRFNEEMEKFIR